MSHWRPVTLGKTRVWVLQNQTTKNLVTDMGPTCAPIMFRTKAEARGSNYGLKNRLGHRFKWIRIKLVA